MKTLEEIINSGNYRHAVVVLKNKQEIEGIFVEVRVNRDSLDVNQKAYDIRHSDMMIPNQQRLEKEWE